MSATFSSTLEGALLYWEQLDCPHSLSMAILARTGEWGQVLTKSVAPALFTDPIDYGLANAACTLLKKNPFAPGADAATRRARAMEKWFEGERACYHTNERFSEYQPENLAPRGIDDRPQTELFRLVRKTLLGWLGAPPSDSELKSRARHGPGTTYSSSVRNPTAADKYSERPTVTSDAVWFLAMLSGTKWSEAYSARYNSDSKSASCVEVVRGNRYSTAPKNADEDRSIGIEASVNVYFQLAVGGAMRSRFKSVGIDLNTAQAVHREMARQASIDGRFATLDLSNASKTIGKGPVRALLYLPSSDDRFVASQRQWYCLLDSLRSKTTVVDGKVILLEEFSSMGNGYTFELETMLFASICSAAIELNGGVVKLGKNLHVFGDDIIVETEHARCVALALEFFGFKINKNKSFVDGPFRESCGGDFFLGHPVRGYYLKRELDEPDALYAFHNGTRKTLHHLRRHHGGIYRWVFSKLPVPLRKVGGGERFGDTVLHGQPAIFKWRGGIRYVRVVSWEEATEVPWKFFSDDIRLACRTTNYGEQRCITARGSTKTGGLLEWATDS